VWAAEPGVTGRQSLQAWVKCDNGAACTGGYLQRLAWHRATGSEAGKRSAPLKKQSTGLLAVHRKPTMLTVSPEPTAICTSGNCCMSAPRQQSQRDHLHCITCQSTHHRSELASCRVRQQGLLGQLLQWRLVQVPIAGVVVRCVSSQPHRGWSEDLNINEAVDRWQGGRRWRRHHCSKITHMSTSVMTCARNNCAMHRHAGEPTVAFALRQWQADQQRSTPCVTGAITCTGLLLGGNSVVSFGRSGCYLYMSLSRWLC
jgi:hypothetical protein